MASSSEVAFRLTVVQTQKGREVSLCSFAQKDFAALVQMYKSFEPKRIAQGLPPPDVPRIAHWLDRLEQKSHGLLAWQDGKVVGHAIVCPMPANAVEFTIFVHQDHRQEGLGTVLSRHALAWAIQMGFQRAYLTTEVSNFRALRLFRKLGFQTTSSYGDEVEMKVDLPPVVCEQPQAA